MPNDTPPRFNVLHIMSDQHQAACAGYEGHPQAITPRLDQLAREGVRFSHAYTANPICTPTRVSVLSGQYCHNHGYYGLSGPVPRQLPDFLSHLGAHGYRTAAVGKLHLPNEPHDWLIDRLDFHGEYISDANPGSTYRQWAVEQGFGDEMDHAGIPGLPGKQQHEARPSKLTYRQTIEGYTNTQAMRFIDACGDEPWAMQVSYFRPHQCYTPPREFWDMYDDNLDLPFGWDENDCDNSARPPHFQSTATGGRTMQGLIEPADPRERARRVWRGYLACITMCDHAVGELLDHLEKQGLADRTIVVYHADHGAYSGMFGVTEKAPGICSEHVCRVPMLWRVPGITTPGHVSKQFAHNVDLADTFVSLCNVPAMTTTDGVDLTPLLRGEDKPLRDVAVTEHPWSKSIRFGPWRYVHYQPELFDGQDHGELYHIDNDPLEQHNLYRSAEHQPVVAEARKRLLDWLIKTTRFVTALPGSRPGGRIECDIAPDGKESNKAGIAARAAAGSRNYL